MKDGRVIAMSSVGADPVVADFANFLYERKTLLETDIDKDAFGWMKNRPKDLQTRFQNVSIVSA